MFKFRKSVTKLLPILLMALVMVVGNVSAAPEAPVRIGTVSGHVTNAEGDPVAGIVVDASPVQSIDHDYATAISEADGSYQLAMPVGVYQLHYTDPSSTYVETWYGGNSWSDAEELPVPGTDVIGIDIVMERGSTVSGSVAFAEGLAKAEYVSLELYQLTNYWGDPYWNSFQWTELMADESAWQFNGLAAGTYRLCAYSSGYDVINERQEDRYQCYGGANNVEDAADIVVESESAVADLVLTFTPPAYTITGLVSSTDGMPLAGVDVYGYQMDGHWSENFSSTNEDGVYTMRVDSGIYELTFSDNVNNHRHTFINVTVDEGDVTDADVTMTPGSGIAGALNISGDGVVVGTADIQVYQWVDMGFFVDDPSMGYPMPDDLFIPTRTPSPDMPPLPSDLPTDMPTDMPPPPPPETEGYWEQMWWGYSDNGETYVVSDLPPGTYRVCAYIYDEMTYMPMGEACHGGGTTPDEAADVIVTEGETTFDIDIDIDVEAFSDTWGTLSGVVTDDAGNPLEGVEVSAEFDWMSYEEPDQMSMLPPPMHGYGYAATDADGAYSISIEPGAYVVRFMDASGNYASETYENVGGYAYEEYTPVTVGEGETVTVDAELATAAKIVGTISITGTGEVMWGHVEVSEMIEDGDYVWANYIQGGELLSDGTYQIGSLTAGTYRVCYNFELVSNPSNYGYNYKYGCYDGASTPEEATDVIVGEGETITLDFDVDASVATDPGYPDNPEVIDHDGVITGTVRNADGEALPRTQVQLYKAYDDDYYYGYDYYYDLPVGDQEPVDMVADSVYEFYGAYEAVYTFTDEQGQYVFGSLPDGTYHIGFSDPEGMYSDSFYGGQNDLHDSMPIMIEDGILKAEIDGTLSIAGRLEGFIGLGSLDRPSSHVQLSLMDANYNDVAWAEPNADGSYLFGGLAEGKYILYAYTWDGNYRDEYYPDSQFFEGATPINVVAGEATMIDVVLDEPAGGLITSSNPDMMWTDPWTGETQLFLDPWMAETTLSAASNCPEDTTTTGATLGIGWDWDTINYAEFEMVADESGTWSAVVSTDDWLEGDVTINWTCDDTVVVQEVGSTQLYDPSGTIIDSITGLPIEGATATLYQVPNAMPDTADEERNCRSPETLSDKGWADEPSATLADGVVVSVDASRTAPNFSPAVPSQTTAQDGVYGWEVAEGCWFVQASAPGYASATSPVVGVPPEVTDLTIVLTPNEIPTAVTLNQFDGMIALHGQMIVLLLIGLVSIMTGTVCVMRRNH